MKVEITRNTIVNQKRAVVGQVVETGESLAKSLIAMGKAIPVADAPKVENRETELEAKTSKRGRPAKAKA
jgi:hypothetical protein